ncbi:neuropeptide-like precursor 1 isoform X3 [Megachile rotundata]|uniref:neuropeptide-like precursor 1 isoform X3 n=1 Tax=Megachile rotundata TaxID=143995 RepID=UPI003FD17AE8
MFSAIKFPKKTSTNLSKYLINDFEVTCQNEDNVQCMPRTAFLSLVRLPEVNPNLAAYSRVDNRNRDIARLRALAEESDDAEICVPSRIYSQLLKEPNADPGYPMNGRSHRFSDLLGRLYDDNPEMELMSESQKRSIATLAKNDDLPISIQDRVGENEEDQEKRAIISSQQPGSEVSESYLLSNQGSPQESMDKRNVGTLARDFALPPGRRNIASLVRDYETQTKNNRDRMLPMEGKRNVASLARTFTLPQSGKRNIASVARDYGLPYGKRYVGSLARIGDFPMREQRSVASLAKNSAWPVSLKRGISVPGSVILRALSRHGRSLSDELNARNYLMDLQELASLENQDDYDDVENWNEFETNDGFSDRRPKRQIGFSDEYPLPVMQNTNVFDYEEMMEALNGQYPIAEKRFLETGSAPEMQPSIDEFGYPETFRASKRHIASLARLGWLPSIRAARFSRSPRYLVSRENSADGSSSNYPTNPSTRSLRRNTNSRPPKPQGNVRALHRDYRHGFKFLVSPTIDNACRQKLPSPPLTI